MTYNPFTLRKQLAKQAAAKQKILEIAKKQKIRITELESQHCKNLAEIDRLRKEKQQLEEILNHLQQDYTRLHAQFYRLPRKQRRK